MRALLVRHARAGARGEWPEGDRLRPLDKKGRRQAKALADSLAELEAGRLLSSPYVRCVQTLEPAAERLGLAIEERDELAEGASADEVIELLGELMGSVPALSTHGDVIVALLGPGRPCKKGSVWVLDVRDGQVRPERYLPPPA
jgi:phosphohistidine phosphatase SixA